MRHNRHYLFDTSYLEDFEVLIGDGVGVSKFFGVAAERVFKRKQERSLKNVTPFISGLCLCDRNATMT